MTANYDVAEGLEDALSVRLLKRDRAIIGVPGVGALQHLALKKGDNVLVWKDGDEEDSPAAKALTAGLDVLLLEGVSIRATKTPIGEDVNIILQGQGLDGLRELAARPIEPTLSYDGHVLELSRIDPKDRVKFADKRAAIRKIFKVSVKDIDEDLKKHRPPPASAPDDAGGYEAPPDPEWEGDIVLADTLDSLVTAARRFLVAPAYVYDTTALWTSLSYLVQSEEIDLPIAPQLGFQSLVENSGKSVALEIVATVSYRGYLRSSYTASTLFRRINQDFVTPCLSEFHNILSDKNKDLLAIIDACHRRSEAYVDRTETDPQTGKRFVVSYKCWASLSWGAIGAVPREAHSRSIILFLQAALPDESRALDHSRILQDKALIDVRRQLTKWASGVKKLPTPDMPKSLFNRAADNFRPLFAIAELAGGDWPARIAAAAEAIGKVERVPSLQVRLLTGIRDAFAAAEEEEREAAWKENREARWEGRLTTTDLIDRLCKEEEDGWQEAHHGKRINEYWLRENLRGLIAPSGSQRWREGSNPKVCGYYLHQFNDAFLRYLSSLIGGGETSRPSRPSRPEPSKPAETADGDGRDADFDPAHDPAHKRSSKTRDEESCGRDGRDGRDASTPPLREEEEEEEEGEAESTRTSETITDDAAIDGSTEPNGSAPVPKPRQSDRIKEAIWAVARQHPDWDAARVGKECGRAASVVRRILGTEAKT